ncbi:hypothetical protein KCP73_06685 [Salmonella enterica subsp. enterica]|nr:hypothetical protein KCP73_06685 [Salmonella enterica subsp. enterica]
MPRSSKNLCRHCWKLKTRADSRNWHFKTSPFVDEKRYCRGGRRPYRHQPDELSPYFRVVRWLTGRKRTVSIYHLYDAGIR